MRSVATRTVDIPDERRALYRELEGQLRRTRSEWEDRLERIRSDRRRQSDPLSPDFADQAIQRENDGALDALDTRGRDELAAVDAALRRLADGLFGDCVGCRQPIDADRLRARPAAPTCRACGGVEH